MIEIKVPTVGESISEVTLLKWTKKDGEYVERDEVIAELESEKATFEVNAEQAGVLKTVAKEGDTIEIGGVLANIDETAAKPAGGAAKAADKPAAAPAATPAAAPAPVAEAKAVGKGIIEMKVPTVGESISEVTILKWVKKAGDLVLRDEVIAELESEKATFELNAEEAGQLQPVGNEGDVIKIGDVIAKINTDVAVPVGGSKPAEAKPAAKAEATPAQAPAATVAGDIKATPVASAIIADKKVNPANITPSGYGGKIVKQDVLEALNNPGKKAFGGQELGSRNKRVEKMSNLRKTISRRLVESKNTTAMLTTFNEVDMTRIMDVRKQYKDKFKEAHGVNLGFMSFFSKACAIALSEWPAVNGYIDGDQLTYHDYADISIAVSTPRGLTVPVIRNVESLSMADIEKKVIELAGKARDNKLTMDELQGGTFTITNGGVFGSLLSTPIINLPQSAILGMHKIQERPMAINGQVVIRPMMYIALSYDHRIIDGRESVSFLVRVKELLENPELLLIGKDPVKSLLEL
ncbi:2-oxoglutarate dehydrogenase E2 component [Filimonas lacunae]|uniref:Dihydrolipoyllysine-residue succinyltransferase component of 2-oxoglutarate dehydrogenase complex n=1 Tax=Filimonas lacunae TaxID=477680 RepID=A0A173MAR4_9BACT|nr:2-oxoglutarate dehydrogenase complex dihydrolipoyllysine-residue succinyltransferase [Filimonas lacunae]BAV04581.1 dihydrolipoamide succinyltransferase component (E2) of 2-oxoglutarate dehydrogenase complex [Filimonas lacunae]SIT32767.1 2-oxoglutarate dehydrogenase E2 component [Filimonas lacunae]